MKDDGLIARDELGNGGTGNSSEDSEIVGQGLLSCPFIFSSFARVQKFSNAQCILLLALIAIFLTWQVQVVFLRSDIISRTSTTTTTSSESKYDHQTITKNSSATSEILKLDAVGLSSVHGHNQSGNLIETEHPTQEPTFKSSLQIPADNDEQKNTTGTKDVVKDSTTTTREPAERTEMPIKDGVIRQGSKYVLYFAESGWANQEICLEHAFYIARSLNRTLILPPVLPHLGKGSTRPRDVFGVDSGNFKIWVDPLAFYTNKFPSNKYLPITKVLDHDFSFPGVPTIDAKEFSSMDESKEMSRRVIESTYSHFNTKWIYNRPDLEGTTTSLTRQEYGKTRILNMTYRDIAVEFKNSTDDILILLDGFISLFDESSMNPPFRPRMTASIRQAARMARERWQVPAYAAVHIRGGDGIFQQEEKFGETVATGMAQISLQLTEWVSGSNRSSEEVSKVGLYVATDVKGLFDHPAMIHEVEELVNGISHVNNVTVEIISGTDVYNETISMGDDLRYASLFMDIQMAACAAIGYVGTGGSTFSQLIQKHRYSNSC